jgi:hypothetical protein
LILQEILDHQGIQHKVHKDLRVPLSLVIKDQKETKVTKEPKV